MEPPLLCFSHSIRPYIFSLPAAAASMAEGGSEVLFVPSDRLFLDWLFEYVSRTSTLCWAVIISWFAVEIVFAAFIWLVLRPRIQQLRPPYHQPYKGASHLDLVKKIVGLIKTLKQSYSFLQFCEGWFLGARMGDIRTGNVISFLSWALFCETPDRLSSSQLDVVTASVTMVQTELNYNFLEGYNKDITHARFTHEQVPWIHRPLAFHLVAAAAEGAADILLLRCRGFRRMSANGINYWIKAVEGSPRGAPILLLHGICSGLFFYSSLISMLSCNRTMIIIETDSIKIKSLVFDLPSPDEFIINVKAIMQLHKIRQVSVVGHSFGSIMAAWLVRFSPELVSHLTLLDPVSLLLALPDVAYNFIYRSPSTIMEHAIFLMASRELTISKMLHRDFYWYNNFLYLEDVPSHIGVVVGIAGKDEVLNSSALREYVSNTIQSRMHVSDTLSATHNKVDFLYWDDYSHGQCLVSSAAIRQISGLLAKSEAALFRV